MAKYAIVTDSASDLPKKYRDENHIDYAATMMAYEDGENKYDGPASIDWEHVSVKEFYDILRRGIRIYTDQVTEKNYLDTFIPHLEKGEDILYVACSSGLSGSLNKARKLAEDDLKRRYPERKIIVVDTLRAGMAQGMIVMLANDLRKEGKTIEENAAILELEKRAYKEVGIPESLSYLRRAGRVSAPAAVFGNIIGLKPILVFDDKGSNLAVEKTIGKKKAFKRMAEMIRDDIVEPEKQTIYLMNADCSEQDVKDFTEAILAEVKVKDIIAETLGPVIGASSGPGTIIVNYKGKQ